MLQIIAFIIVGIWLISSVDSCGKDEATLKREAEEESARIAKDRQAYETVQRAREEGAKALDETDAAIAASNERLRSELAEKSTHHQMYSRGPVRVDVYTMPDGRMITCDTVVYDSGPILNCDGSP